MAETLFTKFNNDIFKREVTSGKVSAFIFDKSNNGWRPISIGNLAEAEMYGRQITKEKDKEKLKKIRKIKQKEFYLVEELAQKIRVSNMTIYRYIKAKKIKAYKIGKEFRIDKKEFDNFLNKVKTK